MPGSERVRALVRAMDVLEFLAQEADGSTLQEIAQALGLRLPTVHNLLRTLASRGYVERLTEPVRYRLGPACERLADVGQQSRRQALAAAELRGLAARCPEAILNWSELRGDDIWVCLRVDPRRPAAVHRPSGQRLPPYTSAGSLVVLTFAAPEQLSAYCRSHPFWEEGVGLWREPARLDNALAGFRQSGVVILALAGDPLVKLAVPLFERTGMLAGILGLAVPAEAVADTVKAGAAALLESARRLQSASAFGQTGDESVSVSEKSVPSGPN